MKRWEQSTNANGAGKDLSQPATRADRSSVAQSAGLSTITPRGTAETKWACAQNAGPRWNRAGSVAGGNVFAATAAAKSTIESRGKKNGMSRGEGNRSAQIAGWNLNWTGTARPGAFAARRAGKSGGRSITRQTHPRYRECVNVCTAEKSSPAKGGMAGSTVAGSAICRPWRRREKIGTVDGAEKYLTRSSIQNRNTAAGNVRQRPGMTPAINEV